MKHWISEGLHTLSVTAVHPIGWGVKRIKGSLLRVRKPIMPQSILLSEHEHPVVLVHGIFHNVTAFYQLERALRKRSFSTIHGMDLWTSLRKIEDLAEQLKEETFETLNRAEALRRFSKYPLKVRLVAHSLGGMISRIALLDPVFAAMVDKVIFLGTPHQGSRLSSFSLPPCIRDINAGSALLRTLKTEPLPGNIRYFNLRGDLDLVTPRQETFLPHVSNFSFKGVGHAGLLSNSQVLNSVVEILESPFYDSGSHG